MWIDKGSASSSEILTGALKDNCRAQVVGKTSFGKGLIQAVFGLEDGEGLVLTVARYLTPSGIDIQGRGIDPDKQVKVNFQGPAEREVDPAFADYDAAVEAARVCRERS